MRRTIYHLVILTGLAFTAVTAHAIQTWDYETKEDKMTSAATKFASLTSDNALDLPFPYKSADNHGTLFVRQKGGGPPDVFVAISKGQILCPGYGDGCTVTVRFDNDKPMRFGAVGPNDHSSTSFFIHDTSRFIAAAKKAKRILIQFTMYNAGQQTLEFNPVRALEWGGAPAKKR